MCGEPKPRSGPEGAGLPGAATERLSTGEAQPGYVPRSATWPWGLVRLLGWWPTHASEVYSASGARYGRGGVVQLGRSSASAARASGSMIMSDRRGG